MTWVIPRTLGVSCPEIEPRIHLNILQQLDLGETLNRAVVEELHQRFERTILNGRTLFARRDPKPNPDMPEAG